MTIGIWLGVALLLCLMVGAIFLQLRPGIRKIEDGLVGLASEGYDNAEIRFVHRRSGRSVAFRKEVVGGVRQLLLLVNELNLSASELARLRELLGSHDLQIEARKDSKRRKVDVVVLGHSTERAAGIAIEIIEKVLNLSRLTRFRFEFKGLRLRNSKGEYVESK